MSIRTSFFIRAVERGSILNLGLKAAENIFGLMLISPYNRTKRIVVQRKGKCRENLPETTAITIYLCSMYSAKRNSSVHQMCLSTPGSGFGSVYLIAWEITRSRSALSRRFARGSPRTDKRDTRVSLFNVVTRPKALGNLRDDRSFPRPRGFGSSRQDGFPGQKVTAAFASGRRTSRQHIQYTILRIQSFRSGLIFSSPARAGIA